MTLNLMMPQSNELKPRITVFGVGGAGGNAVNNMIEKNLEGVEFVVANTDAQALAQSASSSRVQMGVKVTEGLGAGARPTVGAAAAEETIEEIVDHLAGAHMCFITAGMGGGTGTGAAPIIAQAARELGVLTVGVVTKPFQFEGAKRMKQAEDGVDVLQKMVDTLIIIPNQNLFRLANEKTTFTEAFSLADDVLYQGVKGVTDLMVRPGLINLDFADVRAVMDEMGKAMMGTGEGNGEDRAIQAAEKAIANPLLDEISLKGAKGVLINITGGVDLTLFELDEAANRIREEVDQDANIIVGSTLDPAMDGAMRVSVVATGIDASVSASEVPVPRRSLKEPLTQSPAIEQAEAIPNSVEPAAPTPAVTINTVDAQDAPAVARADTEPSLFGRNDAVEEDAPGLFRSERSRADDGLPPPAYQPEPAAPAVAQTAPPTAQETTPSQVAPSPEAMARLQAAVRQNVGEAERYLRDPSPAPSSTAHEKSRFGINSLINRMTGHASDAGDKPTHHQLRRQPPVQAEPDVPPRVEEDERIEIPAFLRRQAN
ncbi:MAG: cell division protein FtsZ [Pseudomonadota bacterium]